MAAPNVATSTTCTSDSNQLAVTGSAVAIVTNAAASGKVYRITSLYIANIHATNSGTITVDKFVSSAAYRIVPSVSVPIACAIVPISANAPINLLEGETLRVTANASNVFEAVASYDILS